MRNLVLRLTHCDIVGYAVERRPCRTFRPLVTELRDTAAVGRVGTAGPAAEGHERFAESTKR